MLNATELRAKVGSRKYCLSPPPPRLPPGNLLLTVERQCFHCGIYMSTCLFVFNLYVSFGWASLVTTLWENASLRLYCCLLSVVVYCLRSFPIWCRGLDVFLTVRLHELCSFILLTILGQKSSYTKNCIYYHSCNERKWHKCSFFSLEKSTHLCV